MNLQSPNKVQGKALSQSPFQHIRSASTDTKFNSTHTKINNVNTQRVDLVKKIIVLLDENEKSAELIQQLLSKESEYQKQRTIDVQEVIQLRNKISQLEEELILKQEDISHIETKYNAVLKELDYKDEQILIKKETIMAQEEHIQQLLERNADITEICQQQTKQLVEFEDIIMQNKELKLLNQDLSDQLIRKQDEITELKHHSTEGSDTVLNGYKQKIKNLETKLAVLCEDNLIRRSK